MLTEPMRHLFVPSRSPVPNSLDSWKGTREGKHILREFRGLQPKQMWNCPLAMRALTKKGFDQALKSRFMRREGKAALAFTGAQTQLMNIHDLHSSLSLKRRAYFWSQVTVAQAWLCQVVSTSWAASESRD